MNLDALNKWLTLFANIGVLAGVIFLAFEIQQNTNASLANTRETAVSVDMDLINAGIEHPEVVIAMVKPELTAEEKVQLQLWLIQLSRTREYQWLQYRNGLLDRQTWESFLTGLLVNLDLPRTRSWWNLFAYDFFDDEFVDEVNKQLESHPVISIDDYVDEIDRADALWKSN